MHFLSLHTRFVTNRLIRVAACSALLAAAASAQLSAQQADLETALFLLPNVTFEAIEPAEGFVASYELRVHQHIDHQNPARGTYGQRVFLNHRGYDRPTVILTNGYSRATNRASEIGRYLESNEVSVEHRYFGVSVPDSNDWSFLNLEQATADLHAIRSLLGEIYGGPWVASGISKGGMTTIVYRYFFPDDVAASVPYVAPLQTSQYDERIYEFLNTVGPAECRVDHLEFQRWVLGEKEELLPRLAWYAKGRGWTFEYMGLEAALEYTVLEYPFSFWQYGRSCDEIPDAANAPHATDAPLDLALEYLDDVVGFTMYSDQGVETYGPHFYQAATETGYYGFETEPFEDLLSALPDKPHAAFVPKRFEAVFDSTLFVQITEWVETEGHNFIYLYGEIDTWTAAAVTPPAQSNSLRFDLPGRHHGDARIRNLSPENRERMRAALEEWLGVTLDAEVWRMR